MLAVASRARKDCLTRRAFWLLACARPTPAQNSYPFRVVECSTLRPMPEREMYTDNKKFHLNATKRFFFLHFILPRPIERAKGDRLNADNPLAASISHETDRKSDGPMVPRPRLITAIITTAQHKAASLNLNFQVAPVLRRLFQHKKPVTRHSWE